ncbi:glyoxylate/hydroxypyruvate reductase A [Algoriphagus halophytocola]|uniref:Glyoxylate/hydroxypyruvate reductase A n=1 Tax=Algoriphagus halophytocola TaxID=2991499 RepID=A0ABY6MJ20_9BACT|nr:MULTISPECIES: glyoxylate/hydroxypyruvate reductase A [unclassified Algoriphagus]UZD23787.1 glyoxylate/hydroxypyruvate reductase A [Algoriphagus sp. TR-M5]WBL45081.1 glyoxylate/hydroxypyruvate reductase A [Algoriphagus sp. TR-M9]
MSLAIISPGKNPDVWIEEFKSLAPDLSIEVYPEITEPEQVEYAFLWQHPEGILSDFPNLKMISSMGAGVDHILRDKTIPESIPIVRIVDEKLTWSMTNYVVMAVLNFHRQTPRYQINQTRKVWDMSAPELDVTIGVMGVGALGKDVLEKLDFMGFPVAGFGFSEKKDFPFPYYSKDQLGDFLKKVNVLVCLLPLTPETENILNKDLFAQCNPNTYLINVARGKHLVDDDLLEAIENGQISGAALDVYREEPLPERHPFWENWKIAMTPHIASVTNPQAAAPQVIENINRLESNRELKNVVNRSRGY